MTPRASILYDFCTSFDVFFCSFYGSVGLVSARLSYEKNKDRETGRQGHTALPQGLTPNSSHKVPAIPHKGQNWGKAERGRSHGSSFCFASIFGPLPICLEPGKGAEGQPLNPPMRDPPPPLNPPTTECSRHGGGDGPQGNWIYMYIYIQRCLYIYIYRDVNIYIHV